MSRNKVNKKDDAKKTTIRNRALEWFYERYAKTAEPIHSSKYYQAHESWTKAVAWGINIPETVLVPESYKFVNLLLQKRPNENSFYYLKVPISYLQENKMNFEFNNNKISLFLAAEGKKIFCDQRHKANVPFGQFLVNDDK